MKQLDRRLKLNIRKIEQYLFTFILLINVILRFYNFSSWSFSNDELSAFLRLDFNSISDLFEKGVKVDGHPAFVQLFLYLWTGIFGISEFSARLPFVFAGIAGSIYFYCFIKKFVNKNAALLSFAAITCSQLFIQYSQLARPYSIGFLFVSAFAYYWFDLLQNPKKRTSLIGFILAGFFGIISHYFASLSITVLLVFGLLFWNKENIKSYIIGGVSICLLFLPHINITLYQISIGGVEWVPPPTEKFIPDFFLFTSNGSNLVLNLIAAFPLIALLSTKTNFKQWRIYLLPLLFFIPYYIAYEYSISKTPVLQFSVLIFSIPFLIASFFSFFSKDSNNFFISGLVSIILATGILSLIVDRGFYTKRAFADFKSVSEKVIEWNKEFGVDNIIQFSNSNNPIYLDYYFKKQKLDINFSIDKFEEPYYSAKARDLINQSDSKYALIAFANVPVPSEVYEFVKNKYPQKIKQFRGFNSDVSLYKMSSKVRETNFKTEAGKDVGWSIDQNFKDTSLFFTPPFSYRIPHFADYSFNYKDTIKNIFPNESKYIVLSGQSITTNNESAKIVVSIDRNGKSLYWRACELRDFKTKEGWNEFMFVSTISSEIMANDIISIYVWNSDKISFQLDNFKIANYMDSDYNYYEL